MFPLTFNEILILVIKELNYNFARVFSLGSTMCIFVALKQLLDTLSGKTDGMTNLSNFLPLFATMMGCEFLQMCFRLTYLAL